MVLILSNSAIDLHLCCLSIPKHSSQARETGMRLHPLGSPSAFPNTLEILTYSIATRLLRAQTARMIFNYSSFSSSYPGHSLKARRYMGCTPLNQFFPGCDAEEMEVGRLVQLLSEYPRRGWARWTINMLTRSSVKLYWTLLIVPNRHRCHQTYSHRSLQRHALVHKTHRLHQYPFDDSPLVPANGRDKICSARCFSRQD